MLEAFKIELEDVEGAHLFDQEGVEIPSNQFTDIVSQYVGCSHFRINVIINSEENGDYFTSVSHYRVFMLHRK